jgi:hypothetical protein
MPSAEKDRRFHFFRRDNLARALPAEPVDYVFAPLTPFVEPQPLDAAARGIHLVAVAENPTAVSRRRPPVRWFAVTVRNTISALNGMPRASTRKRRARLKRRFALRFFGQSERA